MASRRTAKRRERLEFVCADMNELELPAHTFDAMMALDTLYWVEDLPGLLAGVARSLRPGGRMGIFMLEDGDAVEAGSTRAGRALTQLGLEWSASDCTSANARFWRRMWQTATRLRSDYEAEGNGFIAASLIREAEEEFLPAIEAGTLVRYLFHARV